MSSIQTGIELQDNFSGVMYGIINSVNTAVSSLYDLEQSMNADVDTGNLEVARNEIEQMADAVDELNAIRTHLILHRLLWMGETVRL